MKHSKGSIDSINDGIMVESSGGNTEGFTFGKTSNATVGWFDSKMLDVYDSSKLGA